MNLRECRQWVRGLGQCLPSLRQKGLRELLAQEALWGRTGRWEAGLSSADGFNRIRLRYFGPPEDGFAAFIRKAARLLAGRWGEGLSPPPAGFPWLCLEWDFKRDSLAGARLYAGSPSARPQEALALEREGGRALVRPQGFHREYLKDRALAGVFAPMAGLCPIKDLLTEWEPDEGGGWRARAGWSLRFAESVPWPHFARLGVADPFLPRAPRLAYLLLDRKVAELGFETGALRAYVRA